MHTITGSQKKILSAIIRENGASRATLIEEGATYRAIESLVQHKYTNCSALNVHTLTELGIKTCKELGLWTEGVNPAPIGGFDVPEDAQANEPTEAEEAIERKPATLSSSCLCGCKTLVKGRFAVGHDAKLHGQVLRAKKENAQLSVSENAAQWLASKPWAKDGFIMTPRHESVHYPRGEIMLGKVAR